VPIREVAPYEFDTYGPTRMQPLVPMKETAWFVSDAHDPPVLLGIIVFDETDRDWGWVIQLPDEHGKKRACDLSHTSLSTEREAKKILRERMAVWERTGKTMHRQDDPPPSSPTQMIALGDILTNDEIADALRLYHQHKEQGYGFAAAAATQIIEPVLDRINKKLGQENDAYYLGFAIEYVFGLCEDRLPDPDKDPNFMDFLDN